MTSAAWFQVGTTIGGRTSEMRMVAGSGRARCRRRPAGRGPDEPHWTRDRPGEARSIGLLARPRATGAVQPVEFFSSRQATNRGSVRVWLSRITARLPSVKYGSPVKLWRGWSWSQGPTAIDVAGRLDPLGLQQVFDHVIAGFVDVGVDAVRGQIPGAWWSVARRYRGSPAPPRPAGRESAAA